MPDKKKFRLITIPMSHYCEKARWGLERLGLPYYEERHLQVFHYLRTYWVSKGPNVPVLLDDNSMIQDSTKILKHLDQYASPDHRLYPENKDQRLEVEAWEELFDEVLGVESRRWVYHHYFANPINAIKAFAIASQGVPLIEKVLGIFVMPILKILVDLLTKPSQQNVAKGRVLSREIVAKVDAALADGRQFLVGGRFSAADLSLACMLAPYVLPKNYGIRLPTAEEVPKPMLSAVNEFTNTATGQYVLRLFSVERIKSVEDQPVESMQFEVANKCSE